MCFYRRNYVYSECGNTVEVQLISCFWKILLKEYMLAWFYLALVVSDCFLQKEWPNALRCVNIQDASLSLSESHGLDGYIKSYSSHMSGGSCFFTSAIKVRQLGSFCGLLKQRGPPRGQCTQCESGLWRQKKN